jgi:hypothetical protein
VATKRTTARNRALLLVAVGATAAFVLVMALRRDERRAEGAPPAERKAATTGEAAGLLVGRGGERPANDAPRDKAATGDRAPAAGVRIRGRVVGPAAFPEGSTVFVGHGAPAGVFAPRAVPDADGRFEIRFADPDGEPSESVLVVAAIPGYARGATFATTRGAVADVVIHLSSEPVLRGRVVTTAGRPVYGLRLGFARAGSNPYASRKVLPDLSSEGSLIATATTDRRGDFEVRGVSRGTSFFPFSYDEDWWLEPPGDEAIRASSMEVEIRAHVAWRLRVTVEPDDPSDDPAEWPSLGLRVESESVRSWAVGGAPRALVQRGPVPDGAADGFAALVTAITHDHLEASVRVDFAPRAWRQDVRLSLRRRPAADYGTLVLRSSLRGEDGAPATFDVSHDRDLTGSARERVGLIAQRRPDGVVVVRVPAGTHRFHVRSRVLGGELAAWHDVLTIEAGGETEVEVPPTPVGRLRVEVPRDWEDAVTILTLSRGEPDPGRAMFTTIAQGSLLLPAVPEGTWTVTWGGAKGSGRRVVEIRASAETALDLGR